MFAFSSVLMTLVVALVAILVVAAVNAAAVRARLSPAEARALATKLAIVFAAWLGVLAALVASGLLARFDLRPPPMFLVLGGGLALFVFLGRRSAVGALLDATPRFWLVAIHTMRVPIELVLYALFAAGRFPVHLTFEGRNVDMLVGLAAPVVAYLAHTGKIGSRGLWVWNVASLVSLVNIVAMAITTIPGPLHLAWPGVPNTVVAELPFVFLPGFLVPIALSSHVLSIRQLLREGRSKLANLPNGEPREPQRIGGGL